ncbi:MAG TPA: hypothetical protein VIK61_02190 [Acidimicrobiia bacterium]
MPFLIFVLVASAVGITIVVLRNRPRSGMDASIDEFRRGLRAIAPGPESGEPGGRTDEQGAGRSG